MLGLADEVEAALVALPGEVLGDPEEADAPLDGQAVGGRGPEARVEGALERLDVAPDPCGLVLGRGDDARAVGAERRKGEGVCAREDQRIARAVGLKDADGPVRGRGGDALAIGLNAAEWIYPSCPRRMMGSPLPSAFQTRAVLS